MTKAIANVNIATDTFISLVSVTNIIADTISNEAVTSSNSATGGNTSGNVNILGILSADILSANNVKGGSSQTSNTSTLHVGFANSSVSSNVVVHGYTTNVVSNTFIVTSNTNFTTSSFLANSSAISLIGNTTIGANASHKLIVAGANAIINTAGFNVVSNTVFTGANVNINSANVTIEGGVLTLESNVVFANTIAGETLSVTSNTNFQGTNNFFNYLTANNISLTSTSVESFSFPSNTAAINHSSGNFAFPGDGTTSNVVNSFNFTDFGSVKYTVSASDNNDSTNRLLTEITAVYDYNGTINSTEYGTIFTDTKFMTFTLSANSTHIRLLAVSNSSITNTKVTVVRTSFL